LQLADSTLDLDFVFAFEEEKVFDLDFEFIFGYISLLLGN